MLIQLIGTVFSSKHIGIVSKKAKAQMPDQVSLAFQ